MKKYVTCRGESPEKGFTPVTEQPMIRPCLRTPRYHFGPILFSLTSLKPAFWNHSMYSSSFGKSIHTSAKKRDNQKVGYTGPIRQDFPPIFSTLYASLIPRCGSGQYSILRINYRILHKIPLESILHERKKRIFFSFFQKDIEMLKAYNRTIIRRYHSVRK